MAGHLKILIIGGGAAGSTAAASFQRHGVPAGDIASGEPSDTHYYQPAFTLVGAGLFDMAKTRRSTDALIPPGITRIAASASTFAPDDNSVTLSTSDKLTYDYLVAATGLKLDWDKVDGLSAALG